MRPILKLIRGFPTQIYHYVPRGIGQVPKCTTDLLVSENYCIQLQAFKTERRKQSNNNDKWNKQKIIPYICLEELIIMTINAGK